MFRFICSPLSKSKEAFYISEKERDLSKASSKELEGPLLAQVSISLCASVWGSFIARHCWWREDHETIGLSRLLLSWWDPTFLYLSCGKETALWLPGARICMFCSLWAEGRWGWQLISRAWRNLSSTLIVPFPMPVTNPGPSHWAIIPTLFHLLLWNRVLLSCPGWSWISGFLVSASRSAGITSVCHRIWLQSLLEATGQPLSKRK